MQYKVSRYITFNNKSLILYNIENSTVSHTLQYITWKASVQEIVVIYYIDDENKCVCFEDDQISMVILEWSSGSANRSSASIVNDTARWSNATIANRGKVLITRRRASHVCSIIVAKLWAELGTHHFHIFMHNHNTCEQIEDLKMEKQKSQEFYVKL